VASHSLASRTGSFAKGFTSRSSCLTTNAPSRRCDQRSSRTIEASAGPDLVGDEMPGISYVHGWSGSRPVFVGPPGPGQPLPRRAQWSGGIVGVRSDGASLARPRPA
jgi:hypothetical protein